MYNDEVRIYYFPLYEMAFVIILVHNRNAYSIETVHITPLKRTLASSP